MAQESGKQIRIQEAGSGVFYKGYDKDYKICIFEQTNVNGQNERYEIRCRPEEDCCGNHCCEPEESFAPFWLMIIFIALALLLLLLALATLAYWCSKRKPKPKPPKPEKAGNAQNGYLARGQTYERSKGYEPLETDDRLDRTLQESRNGRSLQDEHFDGRYGRALQDEHVDSRYGRSAQDERLDGTLQQSAEHGKFAGENAHGYINPIYTPKSTMRDSERERHLRQSDKVSDRESQNTVIEKTGGADSKEHREVAIPVESTGQVRRPGYFDEDARYGGSRAVDSYRYGAPYWRRGDADDRGVTHELYEEKFEEKYSVEEYPDEYPDYSGSHKRPIK